MSLAQVCRSRLAAEICQGLQSCLGKLNHLGVHAPPKRSTLSYANGHRPWELFQDVFYELLETCRRAAPGKKRKFRFKNKLLSLDATVIDLCETMFDWSKSTRVKGAVKLHVGLDHDGYWRPSRFAVRADPGLRDCRTVGAAHGNGNGTTTVPQQVFPRTI